MVKKITGALLLLAGAFLFTASLFAMQGTGPTWPTMLGTLAGIGLAAVGVMDTRAWYRQHPEQVRGRGPARAHK